VKAFGIAVLKARRASISRCRAVEQSAAVAHNNRCPPTCSPDLVPIEPYRSKLRRWLLAGPISKPILPRVSAIPQASCRPCTDRLPPKTAAENHPFSEILIDLYFYRYPIRNT